MNANAGLWGPRFTPVAAGPKVVAAAALVLAACAAASTAGPSLSATPETGAKALPPASVAGDSIPGEEEPGPRADALITDYAAALIARPPVAFGWDSTFYRKYTDAGGIPVISSAKVPDAALLVARDIINHMLLKRPDVRAEVIRNGSRVGIMAITEFTTDIPEQRDWKKPAIDDRRLTPGERARYNEPGGIGSMTDKEYWDRRARGMGGRYTTAAEENVLGYPGTRYFGEHILVHEFSHGLMSAVRNADTALYRQLQDAYRNAQQRKLYLSPNGSPHYAVNTIAEYWAEGTQWWFWSNYPATFAKGGVAEGERQEIWSPADLKRYDPALYDVLGRMYPDNRIPLDIYHGKRLRSGGVGASGAGGVSAAAGGARAAQPLLLDPTDARWNEAAPAVYVAEFGTSRGVFAIEVRRDWAPLGADRFYHLVRNGYFDEGRFHRVLPGYIAQWGLHGNPEVYRAWKEQYFADDPVRESNTRGAIGFAMTGPNLRSVQVYINLADNSRNDTIGFAPFGRVIEGMEVVDSLYSGYGENSGGGLRGGKQGPLEEGGNAYLAREYPKLDFIRWARIRSSRSQ
jgi:cyclophilin family peptidyl-prolyl cis-trans isomerase